MADDAVVRGDTQRGMPSKVVLAMIGLYIVFECLDRHWFWLIMIAVYLGVWVAARSRQPTVVSADGIEVSGWFWSVRHLGWSDVASVTRSGAAVLHASVTLTDGTTVKLPDVAGTESARIAKIGGKPLVAPPAPSHPAMPLTPRRPTEVEADRELERRSAQLAADRQRLRSQLRT